MSAPEAANLRLALGRAVQSDAEIRGYADTIASMIVAAGLLTPTEVRARWQKGVDRFPNESGVCAPLGRDVPGNDLAGLGAPPTTPKRAAQDSAYETP